MQYKLTLKYKLNKLELKLFYSLVFVIGTSIFWLQMIGSLNLLTY